MAALNDLLAVYTPTRDVTANKAQLIEDLGGDQDTVYANLLAATGLTRATASFNDALHAYLEAYQPLGMFDWKAAFYGGDPLWTPPADGDPVSSWRNGGSTRSEGAYLSSGLVLPGSGDNFASVPDEAAIRPTGDMEIVVHVNPADFSGTQTLAICGSATSPAAVNYHLFLNGSTLTLARHSGATVRAFAASAALSLTEQYLKVTFDQDNGSSQSETRFYTSSDGSSWSEVGAAQTNASTGAGNSNTSGLRVGQTNPSTYPFEGSIYSLIIKDGIDGTNVLDVDFTGRSDVNQFTCSTGQTVTVHNTLDASQATGTKQPAYRASVAALNDQPAVQGDGVDDFLQTAAWSSALSQPGTIVVVGNYGTAAGGPALVDGNAATGRWRVVADSGNYRIHAGTAVDGSALSVDVGLYVATFGSPDTLDFNGSQVVSGNAGTGVMGGVTIGAYASTGLGNHTGHYAFVGVIAGDVTAEANWPAFVAWVETHYGITVA